MALRCSRVRLIPFDVPLACGAAAASPRFCYVRGREREKGDAPDTISWGPASASCGRHCLGTCSMPCLGWRSGTLVHPQGRKGGEGDAGRDRETILESYSCCVTPSDAVLSHSVSLVRWAGVEVTRGPRRDRSGGYGGLQGGLCLVRNMRADVYLSNGLSARQWGSRATRQIRNCERHFHRPGARPPADRGPGGRNRLWDSARGRH